MTSNNVKFIINIEIDDRSHQIVINPFEDVKEVAQSFIRNEQLDSKLVDSLTDHIKTFLKAANKRAVNRINFEKNFVSLSNKAKEDEDCDYDYSLHDSGLTQPDVTLGVINNVSAFDAATSEIRGPVSNRKMPNHSIFKTQEDEKSATKKQQKREGPTSVKRQSLEETRKKTSKPSEIKERKTVHKSVNNAKPVKVEVMNKRKTKHTFEMTKVDKKAKIKTEVINSPVLVTRHDKEDISHEDLFEIKHCVKQNSQTQNLQRMVDEDIESKGFYQPTTSYINKLLAEHSPDGTIDMELVRRHYNAAIETPKDPDTLQNNTYNILSVTNQEQLRPRQRAQSATRSMKSAKETQFVNRFNQRFYYEQVDKLQARQRYIQDIKTLQELEKEMETFPFKPEINQVSAYLAKERKEEMINVEDHLLNKGKELKDRKRNIEMATNWQKDNEFEFKPKINRQSEDIALRKSFGDGRIFTSKYDELYELAKTRNRSRCSRTRAEPQAIIKASEQSNYLLNKTNIPLNFLDRQNFLNHKLIQHKMQLEMASKPTFQPQLISKPIHTEVS